MKKIGIAIILAFITLVPVFASIDVTTSDSTYTSPSATDTTSSSGTSSDATISTDTSSSTNINPTNSSINRNNVNRLRLWNSNTIKTKVKF